MSGTDMAYGGICLLALYAIPGTEIAYGAMCRGDTRVWCYATSGTDIAYGAMRRPRMGRQRPGQQARILVGSATCLRACYAMPGTVMAYGTLCRRAYNALYARAGRGSELSAVPSRYRPTDPYAISGTDIAYGATTFGAVCGTEIAYGWCGTEIAYCVQAKYQ
eukprot:3272292-Rhodomonas_salina.1